MKRLGVSAEAAGRDRLLKKLGLDENDMERAKERKGFPSKSKKYQYSFNMNHQAITQQKNLERVDCVPINPFIYLFIY